VHDLVPQPAPAQLHDGAQEPGDQLLALAFGFVFLQQQVAGALFEAVNEVEGRSLGQVSQQAQFLVGLEVVAMPAH
jgi:hypothetical protein